MTRLAVKNQNNNNMVLPTNPKSLAELVFTQDVVLVNGQSFLLYDSVNDDPNADRIVIFATSKNMNILALCDLLAMDGTFKSAPPLFHQLYTIHGIKYLAYLQCDCTDNLISSFNLFKVALETISFRSCMCCARTNNRKHTTKF